MQTLRSIGIIAGITLLEISRKQVFYVLLLVAVGLIFGSVALAQYDHQVHFKMLADLCLCVIFFVSSVLAITVTVSVLPGEVEQRTVYPVVAKPVLRWHFLLGKYAGAMGTVAMGMAVMTLAFSALQWVYCGSVDPRTFMVVAFLFLQAAVLGAVALWLSTLCSWPLAWFLSLFICLLGCVKGPLYANLTAHPQPIWNTVSISALNALLPDLAGFNFQDALVHHVAVPMGTLAQALAYAVCYTWAVLFFAMYSFARREL